jgi:xanthine/CO dehydrogenase XdhC/CoxF family maturation factor
MSTPAQISANQRNARSSTGPCTDAGKALCSQNGVSHGPSSNFSVLTHESQSEFDALLASLRAEFSPATQNDQFLVGEMAQSRWKMRRIDRLETLALNDERSRRPKGPASRS